MLQIKNSEMNHYTLGNDLNIYIKSNPNSSILHLGVFIMNGSQNEQIQTNGLAHFIEHTIFNPRYFTGEMIQIYERLLARGAYYDASTAKEFTKITIRCLPESLDDALHFLSLLILPRRPSTNAVETERTIILHEHAMAFSSIHPTDSKILDNAMWGDRSIGLFILGRKENISRFSPEDIEASLTTTYSPEKMLLAMTGPVDPDAVQNRIAELFGGWNPSQTAYVKPEAVAEPHIVALPTQAKRVTLQFGFPGESLLSPRRMHMELIADLLGGGTRSLLFHHLRQVKKLAYLVHAAPVTYALGGYVGVYINCDRSDVEQCFTTVNSALTSLRKDGIDPAELERTKLVRLVAALDAMEINSQYLSLFGRRALFDQPFDRISEAELADSIDAEQINALTSRMFAHWNPAVVAIGLEKEEIGAFLS